MEERKQPTHPVHPMTFVILSRPSSIDRDADDRLVKIPGTGLGFSKMMAAARLAVPDVAFKYFESWER